MVKRAVFMSWYPCRLGRIRHMQENDANHGLLHIRQLRLDQCSGHGL
jgi:hypothetical protein